MLTSMGDLMRTAYARGLITTRDGNVSVRRGNTFYITPSGGRKTIIQPEHIIKMKVSDGGKLYRQDANTTVKPSGELEMHRLLQTTDFKGPRAVVHLHPTHIIAAMHRGFDLQQIASQFPEVSRYTRVGPSVPVLPVTSEVLALATHENMTKDDKIIFDIIGQAGHGVCAVAKTPWDAFEHIERLEHVCQIVLVSGVEPK